MEQHKKQFSEAGLQVVAVAMGLPKHGEHFCGRLAPSITCLMDETPAPYFAYGLSRVELKDLITGDVVRAGIRAYLRGHHNGRVIGDSYMLPGNLIVNRAGIIQYVYYSKHAGDHPPMQDIISAAQTVDI